MSNILKPEDLNASELAVQVQAIDKQIRILKERKLQLQEWISHKVKEDAAKARLGDDSVQLVKPEALKEEIEFGDVR